MSGLRAGRRALVCAPLPPEYDRESGSKRMRASRRFLNSGLKVLRMA